MQSQLAERPVLAGQIPPGNGFHVMRVETGLGPASLPIGGTTVLIRSEDSGSGLGRLGGTGKTSLAASLARAHFKNRTAQFVFWVAATDRDAVISGYADALEELEGPAARTGSPERAAGRLVDWLAGADVPWLVVIDDLRSPDAIEGLWPSGAAGRVLVTTEHPDAAAAAHQPRVARVGALSPREALAYLSGRLEDNPDQRVGAVDLLDELKSGPAALGLAGSFMVATGVDCRQYRARFAERRQSLASALPDEFSATAAATWWLSCELADQVSPRGTAMRALAMLSMLTPHGIPGVVLTTQAARAYITGTEGAPSEGAAVRAALQNLGRAGLITVSDQSTVRTVLVHDIVQALTRQHLPAAECERAAQAAADALAQAWSTPEAVPPVTQALRDCAAKLHEISGNFLWKPQCHPVLLAAGQSLERENLSGPAVTYWRVMLGFSRQMLGEEHPQTVGVRARLAGASEVSGDHQTAIDVYEAALGDPERAFGTGFLDRRDVCERLIQSYLAAGRIDDAIRVAETAFRGCERNFRQDHPDTLAALENLARTYLQAGRLDEAAASFEHVLSRREHVLGQNDPATMSARAGLAEVYREAGEYKTAIDLGKRILADREREQGADHPDTISARSSLASSFRGAKKLKEALKLYERTLADRERLQGADHPDTILARSDVALGHLMTKKLGVAIQEYERMLADSERALGPDDPITKSARRSLDEAGAYATSVLGIDLRSRQAARR